MDAVTTLVFVILGLLLGAVGQGARAVVGIKKQFDQAAQADSNIEFQQWFNVQLLILSLAIGAIAGGLASLLLMGKELNTELLLGLVAAGYAGTDFIEGFMKTKTPQVVDISEKTKETIVQKIQETRDVSLQVNTEQLKADNQLKMELYSVGKISDADRVALAKMDEEALQIQARRVKRDTMRHEWIVKGISVSASDAYKLYKIDGFTDDSDVQRACQLNEERAKIIEKYKNI